MKKMYVLIVLVLVVFIPVSGETRHNSPREMSASMHALKKGGPIRFVDGEWAEDYLWLELALFDERYPLTIDLLKSREVRPRKIAFMVAPCGFNFRFTYFSPRQRSMAKYLVDNGYLVVGITFREDMLPPEEAGEDVARWGIEKHVADMRKVIAPISRALRLPYILLGQSSGAICILDYASKYSSSRFDKIVLIDTDSFDPDIQPEKVEYASRTQLAMTQLMEEGILVDAFAGEIKELILGASLFPQVDSGLPRPPGLSGNFTLNGLLHYSLIFTSTLPGIHSEITGLPGEWAFVQGAASGYYTFGDEPIDDDFGFSYTEIVVLAGAAAELGFGSTPLAFARDAYGLLSLNGSYTIDWAGIEEEVVMVNGELSSGDQTYYATLLQRAGNENVSVTIVPDYAYVDMIFGTYANEDVWPHLLQ